MSIRDNFWSGLTRPIDQVLFRAQFALLKTVGLGGVAPEVNSVLSSHCRKVSSGPFWVSPTESMGIRDDFWLGLTRLIDQVLLME